MVYQPAYMWNCRWHKPFLLNSPQLLVLHVSKIARSFSVLSSPELLYQPNHVVTDNLEGPGGPREREQTMEPQFAFSIPSKDDTPLDCRIYHPKRMLLESAGSKGAVIAHPYAPLGGSYDDHVVAALTETLLGQGYVVGTFNFRYARDG